MPSPATLRKHRLRMTKAQLIEQIDTLEQRVAAIDRRYQTIMANVPGAVYQKVLHPDGSINFPYVSEGLRQTHGLDPEEVMRDPAAWLATTHPDDRECLKKSNAESIEKLEDWNLEYRIVARDGTTKWVRGTSHVRHDTNGDVVWDGVLLDITEEHLSQQRISDLAKFPSENPNPIVRVKPDGKVLYANNTARAVDGLIVGGRRSTLTRKLGKTLDAALHGRKGRAQEFTSDDRMFAFVFTPVPDESYINVYGRDITEEHRTKQELVTAQETSVAAEALLRDAIDNTSEGFVVYDSNERLVTCNQKWKEIYGYSDEDVTPGVKYEDLVRFDLAKGVIADQCGQAESYYKHRLAYRKEKEGEFEIELADGRWILIRERLTSSGGRVGIQADITERKRAEKALRESEERYAMAMKAIDEGVYEWNVDTDEFYSSSDAFDILGLPVKEIKSRKDFLERIHPDDRQRYRDAYVALLKGETERLNCDVRYRDSEGNWRGARQHAVAVRDENGRAHRVVGASGDITELMQREQALRDSREMLFAVVNAVPAMINAKDRDSRYLLINRYQAELYGVSEDEAIGKTAENLLGRKYGAHTRRLDRKVITSGEAQPYFEEDHIDAHGVQRNLLATKVPLKDKEEQVRGVVTVALDITARKRAEMELRKNREQLQALADNLPEFISMKDSGGKFIFVNKQFEEWVCQNRNNVIGKTVFDIYSDDQAKQFHALDRQVIDGRKVLPEEFVLDYPDGKTRTVIRTRFPVISSKGEMLGLGTVNHDITERKRAEEALLEAKQQSEEASELVAKKNRMLESLSKQLSKYLPPQVYASIFSGEQTVEIASKRKKLTVFFSDIADFTETTDSLEPEELTNLLNHYLTEMSKVAHEYGATIDKYVGDGITAFFGDPESRGVKEDARACVNMAIAMQRRMQELQSEWLDRGLEKPFQIRIGINTGFCTVGNFGSEDRMDYTINGSEVNLAARLESHAEVGGILLAHETYSLVKDKVLAEERNALTVKGFAKPVRSYAVVGLYDDLAHKGRIIRRDQEGLALVIDLTKKDKTEAIKTLEDVLCQLKG